MDKWKSLLLTWAIITWLSFWWSEATAQILRRHTVAIKKVFQKEYKWPGKNNIINFSFPDGESQTNIVPSDDNNHIIDFSLPDEGSQTQTDFKKVKTLIKNVNLLRGSVRSNHILFSKIIESNEEKKFIDNDSLIVELKSFVDSVNDTIDSLWNGEEIKDNIVFAYPDTVSMNCIILLLISDYHTLQLLYDKGKMFVSAINGEMNKTALDNDK
jgi:uncharacterized membrane protein